MFNRFTPIILETIHKPPLKRFGIINMFQDMEVPLLEKIFKIQSFVEDICPCTS